MDAVNDTLRVVREVMKRRRIFDEDARSILFRAQSDLNRIVQKLDHAELPDIDAARVSAYEHILDIADVGSILVGMQVEKSPAVSIKILWQQPSGEIVVRTMARNERSRDDREKRNPPNYFSYRENTAFDCIARENGSNRYFASDNLTALYAIGSYKNAREKWPNLYNATAVVGIPGQSHNGNDLLGFLCADVPFGRMQSSRVRVVLETLSTYVYYVLRLIYAIELLNSRELTKGQLQGFVSGRAIPDVTRSSPGFRWNTNRLMASSMPRQLLFQAAVDKLEDAHDCAACMALNRSWSRSGTPMLERPTWVPLVEKISSLKRDSNQFEQFLSSRGQYEGRSQDGFDARDVPREEEALQAENRDVVQVIPPGTYTKESLPPISEAARAIVERVRARSKRRTVVRDENDPFPHLLRLEEPDESAIRLPPTT